MFTTMNPITFNREAEDTIIYRGTADGGVEDDDDQINIADINDIDKAYESENYIETVGDEANIPDSDFDDFDSNDDEASEPPHASQDNEIHEIYYQTVQVAVIGQCRAIYDYTANMYDELTIKYGDIINIHHKQEDGWWAGECEGKEGIFPETYVETV